MQSKQGRIQDFSQEAVHPQGMTSLTSEVNKRPRSQGTISAFSKKREDPGNEVGKYILKAFTKKKASSRSSRGGGGGEDAYPLHPLPRSAPATCSFSLLSP